MHRKLSRTAAVLAAGTVAVLTLASPAAAHVTVNPNNATQGGYAKVAFRVPNEKATASTVKLEVALPADTPIRSVSLRPLAGWTGSTETTTLPTPITTENGEITEAVTKITWTADAGVAIQPGQFQEFEVSLGPLPEVDQIVFKALQTYSDGDVVRWIDEPTNDGSEPEHPAPVLRLAPGAGDAHGDTSTFTATPADTGNGWGVGLGIAGVVIGVAGLLLGLLAYRKATTFMQRP
jgi:uncharacterized protein YcnI